MTKQIYKDGMQLLVSTFPNYPFNSKFYWQFWKELEDKLFLQAVSVVCRTQRELFPNTNIIALILEAVNDNSKLNALEAWEIVRKEIADCWENEKPFFPDPTIRAAVDRIGWRTLYYADDQLSFERSFFIKVYEQLLDRAKTDNLLEFDGEKKQLTSAEGISKIKALTDGIGG